MGTTEVSKSKSLTNSRSIEVMTRQFFDPFVSSPQIPFDIWVSGVFFWGGDKDTQ
jgi:hypothetical protein